MKKISILLCVVFALFTGYSQNATIILEAHNVWGDGTGYQMLLAPTAAGVTLPTRVDCGDNTLYNACTYKIPAAADASDASVLVDGTQTLQIPAGHYSYIIVNPNCSNQYNTIYVAANSIDPTSVADYNFEAGVTYHFLMGRSGSGDGTTLTIFADIPDQIFLQSLTLPAESDINTNVNVSGTIANRGNNDITSYDVTYNVNGGNNVATYTVTGINVAQGATHTFTHNVPVNLPTSQVATINVTVSNANGGAEANSSSLSQDITFYNSALSVPRKVLLEQFTTESCDNCPPATANIANWTASRPDVIWMSHHAGFYTDNFTIPESETLTVFYNDGGGTYAPAVMIDRAWLAPDGDPGPVFFPGSTTPTLLDQRLATPAFVSVDMNGTYSNTTRELSVTVSGEVKDVLPGNDIRLSVFITETNVAHVSQASAPAGYYHHFVARAALAGAYGEANVVTNTAGSTYSKTYTYTLPSTWDAANCHVVAFVNNYASDVNNCPVYNAGTIPVDNTTGVNQYAEAVSCNVYPNPVNDVLNITTSEDMTRIELVSPIGQNVLSKQVSGVQATINVNNFVDGIYFLTIYTQNGKITKKVSISK